MRTNTHFSELTRDLANFFPNQRIILIYSPYTKEPQIKRESVMFFLNSGTPLIQVMTANHIIGLQLYTDTKTYEILKSEYKGHAIHSNRCTITLKSGDKIRIKLDDF